MVRLGRGVCWGGSVTVNRATVEPVELISSICVHNGLHNNGIIYQEGHAHFLSFWIPRNLSNHMDRQARTGDTVLVKSRDIGR